MLNQVVLVGRITKDPEVSRTVNDKEVSTIVLAVPRCFKNQDGIYETDFIRCILWNYVANATSQYCKKGDLIGIRGRIQTSSYEDDNGNNVYATDVVADKVTFLDSSKKKEEEFNE